MKRVKFVYFDIGGVMTDTGDYFKSATTKYKIPLDEFIKFWEEDYNRDSLTLGKIIPQEFWNKAIKKFRLKNAENFNFVESWMSDYRPRKEIHKLAYDLSKKYKIGLLSNIYEGMMPRLIELGKVADVKYSSIVLSNETGFRKPEKEIYEIATKKAGILPEEILFIDDRKDFIEGAKKYGWQTIWFDEKNIDKFLKQGEELLAS